MRAHYPKAKATTGAMIYAAGAGIAAWLGLDSWASIPAMQATENIGQFRKLLAEAT